MRIGGKLVFAETVRLDGDIAAKLASRAVANGGVAIGTALIVPGDESIVERIREASDAFGEPKSASRHGTDLQWRVSAHKMRRGSAPI